MNFIDHVNLQVSSGDGGDGRTSFRHEKFIDRGGPDGGDGGNGGDLIFVASRNQNTLMKFRYHKQLAAENGEAGGKKKMHGRAGEHLRVQVPVGTIVHSGERLLADLHEDGQAVTIAKGGKGGFGNAHFISSVRQAPNFSEKGEAGEILDLQLELKLIADVGVIGLPNAGKSTLLSVISNARPEIADYPFTTLTPNLGVVGIDDETSLLFADIPGLIEGAAAGKGLGDEFLRHVERTATLVHLIDAASEDVVSDYNTIQTELKSYKVDLAKRPQIVALSKIDTVTTEVVEKQLKLLKKALKKDVKLFAISAQAHQNLRELLFAVKTEVQQERAREAELAPVVQTIPILKLADQTVWRVSNTGSGFLVTGHKIEKFAARTDFSNEEGTQRLKIIMRKMGIIHELARQGAKAGDRIIIGPHGTVEL